MLLERHKRKQEKLTRDKRDIIFAIYNTCYAGMQGTKVFKTINKPSDLGYLPGDPKPKKLEGQEALDFLKSLEKKK